MKKFITNIILLLTATLALGACDQDEIVFDHEQPAFEVKDGNILLEVIVPRETVDNDIIYIAGAFNGGDETAAGDLRWQLEKSTTVDSKWGIYLNPSTFVNGKTLADGYHFVSTNDGEERSALNEPVLRTENPAPGSRTNIYVNKWASFFDTSSDDEEESEHDGYVVYVEDNSGWDDLYLYAWGDSEIFGAWPGIPADGEVTIGKTTLKYFDMGEANEGQNINLIFHNNAGVQFDGQSGITVDKDYYYSITADSWTAIERPSEYAGYTLYAEDLTSWGITHVYGWFDTGDVTAAWPGIPVTGEKTINGYTYKYIEMGTELTGAEMNAIFNCSSSQAPDFHLTLDRDYYVTVTNSGVTEVDPYDRAGVSDTFELSINSCTFDSKGTSTVFTLSSAKWDWTISSPDTWVYVTDMSNNILTGGSQSDKIQTLRICADPNLSSMTRSTTLTFSSTDGSQTATIAVSQSPSGAAFLSQWVFQDSSLASYETLWPTRQLIPATNGAAGCISVVRGDAHADVPFTCTVKGKNPNVSTMVEGDYWLFTFNAQDLTAGSTIEFDATMAGDAKSPKYFIVEYLDGGVWKSVEEDLRTAEEDPSIRYTYKCSGDVSTGSGAADSYQYTTVLQSMTFDSPLTDGLVKIRCRAVGSMTCDGSTQNINETSRSACSMPDFGFTAVNVQNFGTQKPTQTRKLLVLGNSFSYYFNPVFMLKEIAWSQGYDLKIKAHLKGSQDFADHLSLSMSSDAIEQGGYDYAIIQDQSTNPAKYASNPTAYASVVDNCVELARKIRQYSPDCKIILDLTWAYPASSYGSYQSYEEFDRLLKEGTMAMAEAADTWVAPVGPAFAQSRTDHSGWSLYYSGDSKHPTRSSAYLKACVEFVTLFGEEFTGEVPNCNVASDRGEYFRSLAESLVIGHESEYGIER